MKKVHVLAVVVALALGGLACWIGRPAGDNLQKDLGSVQAATKAMPPVKDAIAKLPANERPVPVPRPTVEMHSELARGDSAANQRREKTEADKIFLAYLKQADVELPILQEQLAQAEARGAGADQIAESEEKIRRIIGMKEQLLAQHPELASQ